MRQSPISTRKRTRPDPSDALERLTRHLDGMRRHLIATGHRAEASAVRTQLEMVADVRRGLS
jgi:hypothetical protein